MLKEKIESWIKEKVKESDTKGVVFGLSGGIDSAVVAVLCKNALKDKCLGIIMPCYSSKDSKNDAKVIAEKFQINTVEIELSNVFDLLKNIYPASNNDLAYANVKPRLRMITLYYFANSYNFLVAGTGNKSEISVGYFTKYGDGGADILPIATLTKTEVISLAKTLNIPENIIKKPPSAGLWEGQTDEEELGISYNQLDSYLNNNKTSEIDEEIKKKIENMIKASEHKRKGPEIFKVD